MTLPIRYLVSSFFSLALVSGSVLAQRENRPEPVDAGLVEKEVVAVAEIRILVTDRDGRPVSDLEPGEIRVFEKGVEQDLAFLETVSGGRTRPDGSIEDNGPAPLYSTAGEHPPGVSMQVLPAKAVRRVVLAFDVRNSRKQVRKQWQEAVLGWLESGMGPEDRVAVVALGAYPEWVTEFTTDREVVSSAVENLSLKKAAPGRDRGHDITSMMREIAACIEADAARFSGGNEIACSYDVGRFYASRWNAEAEESVRNLGALVGQLAAIPGRKAVALFSEGLVEDASMRAVDAMIAGIGSEGRNLDRQKMKNRMLDRDVRAEIEDVYRRARDGDVTFFALDTKQGDRKGFSGHLEDPMVPPAVTLGLNPWHEMDRSTTHTLQELSLQTGGRSFHGLQDLGENLWAAADAYFGMYTLGYYRFDPESRIRKVRVEIARPNTEVTFTERPGDAGSEARAEPLDLAIGEPRETTPPDGRHVLPVTLILDFDALPLRAGPRNRVGTVLGLHVQAIRPDGTVVAERLDVESVAVDEDDRESYRGKKFAHQTELTLPSGPYRLRGRISDHRQEMIAERAIDLTVVDGTVRPGLH